MKPPVKMLMVFVDETDIHGDVPLYEAIVRKLIHYGVNGATVQSGIMGYGSHQKVHHKRLFGITDDRPITIMAVDNEETLRTVAREIRPMMEEGLIVLKDVEVIE